MRIGFDAKRAFHNTRGLGNYSRILIDGLIKYYPENQYFLFGKKPKTGVGASWMNTCNDSTVMIEPRVTSSVGQALWRSWEMSKPIRENKIDLYHGLSHELPLRMNNNTRYVVTIHDLLFLRFPQYFKWIDIQIYLRKIQFSCKHAHRIIAVSEQTRDDLINFLKVPTEKIEVCYQSCSPAFYQRASDLAIADVKHQYDLPAEYFLFVGALVRHKNIERILEAVAMLQANLQLPLVIVAKPNKYKLTLLQKINRLNIADKVIFVDYIASEHMPMLLQAAKLMIWPSLFEGFGIPIIEAQFSRLPVITSNLGCFPEAGGKGAYYVDPNNSEEISKAITHLMTQNDLYAEMQELGYEHAQKFHLKNTSAGLMKIYSQVAKIE